PFRPRREVQNQRRQQKQSRSHAGEGAGARAADRTQGDQQKAERHHQRQTPSRHSQRQGLSNGSFGNYELVTGPTKAGGNGGRQSAAEDTHQGPPLGRHESVGGHPQQPVPGGG